MKYTQCAVLVCSRGVQHRFPHSCSIFFSHCCSIKLIIAAAFIRSLLQHAHWCITRYSCSIHFLMPPARSVITAASRFSLLQHSFIRSLLQRSLTNACIHSQHPFSRLLIAAAPILSLLQHSFAHCCSIDFFIAAAFICSMAHYSLLLQNSFPCLQHRFPRLLIAAAVIASLLQYLFSHCCSIFFLFAATSIFLIAATSIFSLLQY